MSETAVGTLAGGTQGFSQREPDAYAYRYYDGIRYGTNGRPINGSPPIAVIPLYHGEEQKI